MHEYARIGDDVLHRVSDEHSRNVLVRKCSTAQAVQLKEGVADRGNYGDETHICNQRNHAKEIIYLFRYIST